MGGGIKTIKVEPLTGNLKVPETGFENLSSNLTPKCFIFFWPLATGCSLFSPISQKFCIVRKKEYINDT